MKTVDVLGVPCVVLVPVRGEPLPITAIRELSQDLEGYRSICGLCPASTATRSADVGWDCLHQCPGLPKHIGPYAVVRADVWPILKLRMPPGSVEEP
jgi:hypothetical protein